MNFIKRGSNRVAPMGFSASKEGEESISDTQKHQRVNSESGNSSEGSTVQTDELSSSGSSRSLESLDAEDEKAKSQETNTKALCEQIPLSLVGIAEDKKIVHTCPSKVPLASSKSAPPLPPKRPPARPRHRRTSSAMPRLETLHEGRATVPVEKPPLPPRPRLSSIPSVSHGMNSLPPVPSAGLLERTKSFSQLPNYPSAPPAEGPKRNHRRTNSAPAVQPQGFLDVTTLQQQLKQLQQQYGDSHAMVATTWNWLGNAYFRQGNMEAALQAYKKVVLCEPGEHLADAYANIGTVHWTTGNVQEAIPFLRNALSVHEYNVMSNGQDPNRSIPVAGVQYQLGLALTLNKGYKEALKSLNQARAIREKVLGPNHMDVARTWDALGKVHFLQGDYREALKCHMQALNVKEGLPQDMARSAMSVTIMNIVSVQRAQQNLADAGIWMHRLLAAQKNQFMVLKTKALCADIGASLTTLGDIYDSAMQYSEGAACYREAEMYFAKAHIPEDDPRRVALRNRLD